ncbi:hypothetical protein [Amaricoccus macauensis]|uniref:hypothetical protein n=1 Tax=Amaricoccus macauensis TaxID=57001 RepID=UPI003C7AE86A
MLVGLMSISMIIGAVAGGAALVFGNGILVSLIVYSFTASTVLVLLALWSYSRAQEAEERGKTSGKTADAAIPRVQST